MKKTMKKGITGIDEFFTEKKQKNKSIEKDLQKSVCTWLHFQYPKLLFNSDLSGIKLTIGQAKQAKNNRTFDAHFPDLTIFHVNRLGYGLFIEFKKENPFLKSGKLSNEKHIQSQNETMIELEKQGYICRFCWSFEQTKTIISDYLNEIIF